MASLASSFTDAVVFIYDKNNNLITKTIITRHNRNEMYIEVAKGLENVKLKTRLQLLIIHSGGASELNGTLRSIRQGLFEISIFGERQRDVRTSVRRTLNASAAISDMVTDSESEKPPAPIQIVIENLSATGILIKTRTMRMEIGTFLQIEFKLHGKDVILFSEVVREQVHDGDVYKYGCKLHFLD